jgi:protein-disulfide isomerase
MVVSMRGNFMNRIFTAIVLTSLVIGNISFAQAPAVAPAPVITPSPAPTPVIVPPATTAPATKPTVMDQLSKAGALGDIWLGDPNAPVTIIEYAATTCSHCAQFNEIGFPVLKQKYIETGKVKYTLREFPLNPLDVAGFMLARCSGDKKHYAVVDLLMRNQEKWAFVPKPVDALAILAKQAGFTQETFETCLKDQKIYDAVIDVRDRGEKMGITSTPTFFINGKKTSGAISPKDLETEIEPLLKK